MTYPCYRIAARLVIMGLKRDAAAITHTAASLFAVVAFVGVICATLGLNFTF